MTAKPMQELFQGKPWLIHRKYLDTQRVIWKRFKKLFKPMSERFTGYNPQEVSQKESIHPQVMVASQLFRDRGGRALLVGGGIRDMIMGKDPKDFDIEVYGLEPDVIEDTVSVLGKVSAVGKAFGILKVAVGDGYDLDISLPRSDSKTGEGHRGFEVSVDPFMSIEDAARRRDFTINSLAYDPLTGEVIDSFSGVEDIKNQILRVTDKQLFKDDPLRVMRGLQFAGRFGFTVEQESFEIMAQMVPQLEELPKERLNEEWKKLLLKSEKPSIGLALGMELGLFHQLHPEFVRLLNTPQDPRWHPEGDAWTHTLMAVDQAAKIVRSERLDNESAFTIMLATLCHDLGKAESTIQDENGAVTAYGHDAAGVEPAQKFLSTIGVDNDTTAKVLKLVDNHMWSHTGYQTIKNGGTVGDGAFRKLSVKIHPATISELSMLAHADGTGTGFYGSLEDLHSDNSYPESEWLKSRAENTGVLREKSMDIVMGRDLIGIGLRPGKHFSEIISLANELHNEKGYSREYILALIAGADPIATLFSHVE